MYVEPEDFLHLHMKSIMDETIEQDSIPSLLLELRNRVRDLQQGMVGNCDIGEVWKLGAFIGKYTAEICDYYEHLYYRKED